MSSFDLLKREIREYIYKQGWPSLTKIQEASIRYISQTDSNYILAAPTASGKTEAAFLPAINTVNVWTSGLKIVYISPLIALINDQFKRVSELCEHLNISITSWHGEASVTKKRKLLKNPNGILLITPESIEAMLSLRSGEARNLFDGVEWILVDEIHSFLDNNRGLQLSSLLERIQYYMKKVPRYIGMSATLHDEDSSQIKDFFKNGIDTSILLDRTRNELMITKKYFENNQKNQSTQAIEAIYSYSQQESMLVFPNRRGDVEYISTNLAKMGKKNHSYTRYFAHHSSVSKEMRLSAENFAKNSVYELFTICCTSTLELGIDIGAVDSIVQYNAPHTVASLGQRLGRSGRKTKKSILHFIATNPWDVLQGLAAISLYERNCIDRLDFIKKPYDVLAHQILSLLLEYSGIEISKFKQLHRVFFSWNTITDEEYDLLLKYLEEEKYIEVLENEVITGISTECLLKGPDFFAHFITENNFAVYNNIKRLGEIPLTPAVAVDVNIFLAAQVWKIQKIDMRGKKIYVTKATDGNPPVFVSGGSNVSHAIRQEMKELLLNEERCNSQSSEIQSLFEKLKADSINGCPYQITTPSGIGLRTFAGTRINQTIQVLLSITHDDILFRLSDKETLIYSVDSPIALKEMIEHVLAIEWNTDLLYDYFSQHSDLLNRYVNSMKFKALLPKSLQINYIIENMLEPKAALKHLNNIVHDLDA